MVIFDPSEDECVIIFDSVTVGVPIMEIVESGVKMTVNHFHPGFLLVVSGGIVFASLGIMAKMCTDIPVNVGPARVFRGSAGIRVALAYW